MNINIHLPLIMVLALAANGCKSGNVEQERRAEQAIVGKTACELLTKSEAEQLLGGEVVADRSQEKVERKGIDEAGLSICSYTLADAGAFGALSLLMRTAAPSEVPADRLARHTESLKRAVGDEIEIEDIKVGDLNAIWVESVGQLTYYVGNDLFIISILGDRFADKKDKAISLAPQITSRAYKQ